MMLHVFAWQPRCAEHWDPAVSVAGAVPSFTWGKVHKFMATLPGRYVEGPR
jgi:hypothetical protein